MSEEAKCAAEDDVPKVQRAYDASSEGYVALPDDEEMVRKILLELYGLENMKKLAIKSSKVSARARQYRCEHTLTVIFNDKGYPRFINGSDNEVLVKP